MKRIFIALSFILLFRETAVAGNLTEPVATERTQIMNNLELLVQTLEMFRQTKELLNQGDNISSQLKDMYEQAKSLDDINWEDFFTYTERLAAVVEKGSGISYTSYASEERFKELFEGYDDYLSEQKEYDPDHFEDKFTAWNDNVNEALESTFRLNNFTFEEMQDDQSRIELIRNRVSNSTGRNELIKSSIDVSLFTSEQLRKLLNLQMQQHQTHSTFMAFEKNQSALRDARKKNYFKSKLPIIGDGESF